MECRDFHLEVQELIFKLVDTGRQDLAHELTTKANSLQEEMRPMILMNFKAQKMNDQELSEHSYRAGDQKMEAFLEYARGLGAEALGEGP